MLQTVYNDEALNCSNVSECFNELNMSTGIFRTIQEAGVLTASRNADAIINVHEMAKRLLMGSQNDVG
jgi:hypothetical protein